jgi:hypothetical protein
MSTPNTATAARKGAPNTAKTPRAKAANTATAPVGTATASAATTGTGKPLSPDAARIDAALTKLEATVKGLVSAVAEIKASVPAAASVGTGNKQADTVEIDIEQTSAADAADLLKRAMRKADSAAFVGTYVEVLQRIGRGANNGEAISVTFVGDGCHESPKYLTIAEADAAAKALKNAKIIVSKYIPLMYQKEDPTVPIFATQSSDPFPVTYQVTFSRKQAAWIETFAKTMRAPISNAIAALALHSPQSADYECDNLEFRKEAVEQLEDEFADALNKFWNADEVPTIPADLQARPA